MKASHKRHQPHIKVVKDVEEEDFVSIFLTIVASMQPGLAPLHPIVLSLSSCPS